MIDLKGFAASTPIGFMAALGTLRVLASDRKLDIRLGWRKGHAVVQGADIDKVVTEIMENMVGRDKAPELNWTDSLRKINDEVYRVACSNMIGDQRALGFMAGWATDAILKKEAVSVTRMDMTSGNKKLLKDLRKLAGGVKRNHIESALFGGSYEKQHSFGLDPVVVRTHAHEHQAPTKTAPLGKPGLIWLAFESIPLHPVIPISSNRAQTTGWKLWPDAGYMWPIWDGFLTLEEVGYLRALPLHHLPKRPGVKEIWFSSYGSSGKYGMLLPAQREH